MFRMRSALIGLALTTTPFALGCGGGTGDAEANLKQQAGGKLAAMQQGDTSACTGFALAAVVDRLLVKSGRAKDAGVSPWMLYSMARRYDEFPGAARDTGSSLRGALKGWFKHGACARALWDGPAMPSAMPDRARAVAWARRPSALSLRPPGF